ncbi:MAG: hypothetical protein HC904_04430 [Blastochloris sp.]|nr:hypothetical protein [Blastochloris sp.]
MKLAKLILACIFSIPFFFVNAQGNEFQYNSILSRSNHKSLNNINNLENDLDYQKQLTAIKLIGERQLDEHADLLIPYIDYPANFLAEIGGAFSLGNRRSKHHSKDWWPAYGSLLMLGQSAVDPLVQFINNSNEDISFRLAALQILKEIDYESAKNNAQLLFANVDDSALKSRVKMIMESEMVFSGTLTHVHYLERFRNGASNSTGVTSKSLEQDIEVALATEQSAKNPLKIDGVPKTETHMFKWLTSLIAIVLSAYFFISLSKIFSKR